MILDPAQPGDVLHLLLFTKIILLVLRTTNGATTPSFVTPAYFIIQKTAGSWVMSSVEEEQEKERGK